MKGKFFKKQLEKTRKLLKPSKKLTNEEKLALKVKKENRIEKMKARRKEKRKAKVMNLTEEQIKKKKAKFQAKKQRRLARKKALAWHNKLSFCNYMTYAHFSSIVCGWRGIKLVSNTQCFLPFEGVPQHHHHQQRRELRRQQDKDESLHKNDKKSHPLSVPVSAFVVDSICTHIGGLHPCIHLS